MSGEDKELFLEKMGDLEISIQAFYTLVDSKAGAELINRVSQIKREVRENTKKFKKGVTKDSDEEVEDILTDEDKELLEFMRQQPQTMTDNNIRTSTQFILPKVSTEKLKKKKVVSVDDKKDVSPPKLGF